MFFTEAIFSYLTTLSPPFTIYCSESSGSLASLITISV